MRNFISSSGRLVGFSVAITALMLGNSGCFESLEEKAVQGNSAALLELAEYHRDGKNSAEELRYLQMAAQGKEPRALKMMADYYNKRKDFRQAAYFHVIRLNETGERDVAENYAHFLLASQSSPQLQAAVFLSDALLSQTLNREDNGKNTAFAAALRNAVEKFLKDSRKNNIKEKFELYRDYKALSEKYPELKKSLDFSVDFSILANAGSGGNTTFSSTAVMQKKAVSVSAKKSTLSPVVLLKKESVNKSRKPVSSTDKKSVSPAQTLVSRQTASAVPATAGKQTVSKPEVSRKAPPRLKFSESVKGVSSKENWILYLKKNLPFLITALNSGKSFSDLRPGFKTEKGGILNVDKRQAETLVKIQYKDFAVRYFFRNGKIAEKKASDVLYKIEIIPPRENERTFIKKNSPLFAGVRRGDFTFEIDNCIWFCECKINVKFFQHQEAGIYYTLFSPGQIVKFKPLMVDSPQYAAWLEKVKRMVNLQGYVVLKTPGQVDYYRPEECSKWFRVLPQNEERVKKAICASDEAAGKLILSKFDLLK